MPRFYYKMFLGCKIALCYGDVIARHALMSTSILCAYEVATTANYGLRRFATPQRAVFLF